MRLTHLAVTVSALAALLSLAVPARADSGLTVGARLGYYADAGAAFLGGELLAARSLGASDASAIPAVLVRGVLVDASGAPLKGGVLHVAPLDTAGKAFVELRDDEILNPTDTTDEGGKFTITVPVAFFVSGSAFTVGVARAEKGMPPGVAQFPLSPVRRNGVPASFPYRTRREVIDLGEVTLPSN